MSFHNLTGGFVRGPGAEYSDEFMMWCFKVVDCDNPEHSRADWDMCPFAHAGEVVTRRPPQTHLPKLCPKARRACRKGRACPYAHNVFEHWLHPSRFKTEICQHAAACTRPMCFFAHYPDEVRAPSPSADEVMAAAEAAGLLGRPHGGAPAPHHHHGSYSQAGSAGASTSGCSRRSSATNYGDMGGGGFCIPSASAGGMMGGYDMGWMAQQAPAPMRAQAPQQHQMLQPQQRQLADRFSADLALAQADLALAQCLQAQQAAAAAVQQQQAQQARSVGWSSGDWALLSSGGSSPTLLATPRSGVSPTSLMGAAAASHFGAAPSQPLPAPQPAAAPFDIWSLGPQPAAPLPPLGADAAALGLSSQDALLLLAGLPRGAANNYLCALQAEQARLGPAARSFY